MKRDYICTYCHNAIIWNPLIVTANILIRHNHYIHGGKINFHWILSHVAFHGTKKNNILPFDIVLPFLFQNAVISGPLISQQICSSDSIITFMVIIILGKLREYVDGLLIIFSGHGYNIIKPMPTIYIHSDKNGYYCITIILIS